MEINQDGRKEGNKKLSCLLGNTQLCLRVPLLEHRPEADSKAFVGCTQVGQLTLKSSDLVLAKKIERSPYGGGLEEMKKTKEASAAAAALPSGSHSAKTFSSTYSRAQGIIIVLLPQTT